MKKLGTTDGKAIVILNSVEFSGLAGKTISSTPDGTDISLAKIKEKLDLYDANVDELATVKQKCNELITSIDNAGA